MDWTEELGNFGTHHAEGYRVTYIRPECWRIGDGKSAK